MLHQIKKTIGLAIVTFAFCSQLSWAGVNIPDWVRQAASRTVPKYEPDTNAVVLLDQTDFTVTAPGEYLEHSRHVVKILRHEGRDEGDLAVHLEQKEKLLSIHAWTIDATGHEYELKDNDKDFSESSAYFGFDLYNDIRIRRAQAPASDPGSVVAFEYEVRRHAWINQLNWLYQDRIPVREAGMSLLLPPGWEYKTSSTTADSVQLVKNGDNRWTWTIRDVPAIEHETMMPAFLSLSGRMEISYFGNSDGAATSGSWAALGDWYTGLTAGRRNPTTEISDRAHQLTAGKTSFDGKVKALTEFLQSEVRYVEIQIGIGGYQPHPAGDIFHARYGDCKDKATLLSSMLQEVGIKSNYVLIDTERGVVHPNLPSTFFNHAILAIELPAEIKTDAYQSVVTAKTGKRYIIFDPTDEYTPAGELRSQLQNTYALLVTDSGGELIHTPLLSPDTNLLTRTGHFTLSSDGTLGGEVMEDSSGDHASTERWSLVSDTQQQRSLALEHRLGRSLQAFTVQSSDIQHLDQIQQDLIYKFKFTTPQYAQIRGPLMLVRPRVMGEKSSHVEQERKPRQYPLELRRTSRETDTYEIEIPQDYKVDDIPDPVKIDVGFASYQSKVEVEGTKIRYWREYVVRDLSVNADHIADWRKLQGVIGSDEAAAVVLKHNPQGP
jgi:transglutaminase-like putative cysteine protease